MEVLNKLSPEEQQKVEKGFGSQMRLTPFYEAQIQRRITEQSKNAIHINAGRDFGSGTGEQQDEFQEDFLGEPQQLEIRILYKKNKKHNPKKHQSGVGQSPWTIVQLDELSGTAREGLRSVKHKTVIEITHQLMAKDIPKGMQHQQIAGEAAQLFHAPGETFSINGNVKRVASSTDSIVSGQIGVAGTKPTNIQTASSTQFQGNPVRKPKMEKKGGWIPVGSNATSTNISVVANKNQIEDEQR
ncbi:MAG: hypothetical protein EZS28_006285 [Streblomastix strix]|uniref:Uncharacterized protein n=1 Tax=Streblomastix strix TaxID=222440 RepID=A0A5J4WUD5_9EUKA|nr:MAG: hypothetical protein EZS28_006285 [Streblomastix strix]